MTTERTAERCEIAIVGGGMVGAALALALVQRAFDVRLIERGSAPGLFDPDDFDARVYAISPGSARFLRALGVWDEVLAARAAPYEAMRVWSLGPARSLQFSAAEAGLPCLGWIVEQHLMRTTLWHKLPAPVLRPNTGVTALRAGERGMQLQLSDGSELQARLLVSAEGADACLRDLAGIPTRGWSYEQQAVVCHVETAVPHEATALQRFLPQGPLAFLPLPDGRRSIVWSTSPEEAQALCALSREAFHQRLAAAIEHEVGAVTASTERFTFPLRLLHAEQYVQPGIVLVGDSAHVVHPLAGQGVNLGLGDAATLADVLAEARDAAIGPSWTSLRVLRRYERARKTQNQEMLALTDLLNRAFRAPVPGLPGLLGAGMRWIDHFGPIKQMLVRRALR